MSFIFIPDVFTGDATKEKRKISKLPPNNVPLGTLRGRSLRPPRGGTFFWTLPGAVSLYFFFLDKRRGTLLGRSLQPGGGHVIWTRASWRPRAVIWGVYVVRGSSAVFFLHPQLSSAFEVHWNISMKYTTPECAWKGFVSNCTGCFDWFVLVVH